MEVYVKKEDDHQQKEYEKLGGPYLPTHIGF